MVSHRAAPAHKRLTDPVRPPRAPLVAPLDIRLPMPPLWEHVDQTYAVGWRYAGEPCSIKRLSRVCGVVRAVAVEANGVETIHIADFKGAFQNDMLKGAGLDVGPA